MIARSSGNGAIPANYLKEVEEANLDAMYVNFDINLLPQLTDTELEFMADAAEKRVEDRAFWGDDYRG